MNLVDHLSEKYNVELTGVEGNDLCNSRVCLDITSHFEEVPPFVKKVMLCIVAEKLTISQKESEEYQYGYFTDRCLARAIKQRDVHSPGLHLGWEETLVLICDGGYVIKVSCEEAFILMKKIDDPYQILCAIEENLKQIKEQKKKEQE